MVSYTCRYKMRLYLYIVLIVLFQMTTCEYDEYVVEEQGEFVTTTEKDIDSIEYTGSTTLTDIDDITTTVAHQENVSSGSTDSASMEDDNATTAGYSTESSKEIVSSESTDANSTEVKDVTTSRYTTDASKENERSESTDSTIQTDRPQKTATSEPTDSTIQTDRPQKTASSEPTDSTIQTDRPQKTASSEPTESTIQTDRSQKTASSEPTDSTIQTDRPQKTASSEPTESTIQTDRPQKTASSEPTDSTIQTDRPQKTASSEPTDSTIQTDRPQKTASSEPTESTIQTDRPQKTASSEPTYSTTIHTDIVHNDIPCMYDEHASQIPIQTGNMQLIKDSNGTQAYINSFGDCLQRHMIRSQLEICPLTPLCGYQIPREELSEFFEHCCLANCSCDVDTCVKEGTCCPDATHIDLLNQKQEPSSNTSCVPLELHNKRIGSGVNAIVTCPGNTDPILEHKCTRPYTTEITKMADVTPCGVPECGPRRTTSVYRNIHCALCNGELESDVHYFDAFFEFQRIPSHALTSAEMISMALDHERYTLVFEAPWYLNAEYCDGYIDTCNVTGWMREINSDTEEACNKYTAVTYIRDGEWQMGSVLKFRNPFCAFCNGYDMEYFRFMTCDNHVDNQNFAFYALISVAIDDLHTAPPDPSALCGHNQYYDEYKETCRDITCSFINQVENGECIEAAGMFRATAVYQFYVQILPLSNTNFEKMQTYADYLTDEMQERFTYDLRRRICDVEAVSVLDSSKFHDAMPPNASEFDAAALKAENVEYLDISIVIEVYENTDFEDARMLLKDLEQNIHNVTIHIDDTEQSAFLMKVVRNRVYDQDPLRNKDAYTLFGNGLIGIRHPKAEETSWFCDPMFTMGLVFIEPLTLGECRKIQLTYDDIPWHLDASGTLIIGDPNDAALDEYVVIDDKGIVMCIDTYETYAARSRTQSLAVSETGFTTQTIVSYICSTVSILALAATITTFALFPKLRRTLPGKNNMTLAIVLLCANSLFIISSVGNIPLNSLPCKVLGCFVHFFWLESILWMNICTYHVFRVLTRTQVISASSGWGKYFMYHAYAATIAVLFICSNIVTSLLTTGDVGYGQGTCYVSSPYMILYTFALPTGLVIVSNVVMFCLVIISIRRTASVQRNVQNERNDLAVFAKLSTITGLTWSVGLVNMLVGNLILEYLFTFLNAGQGLLIFLAFVVNKSVAGLYREMVPCKEREKTQQKKPPESKTPDKQT